MKIIIYVGNCDLAAIEKLKKAGVTGVMAAVDGLTSKVIQMIRRNSLEFGIAIQVLVTGDNCPAAPEAEDIMVKKIEEVIKYAPDLIWFDHLRFPGRWEVVGRRMRELHENCRYCKNKDRGEIIVRLAKQAVERIGSMAQVGYFAVPYFGNKHKGDVDDLGQDHSQLCQIFDWVSPMCYQRMLGEPVDFIRVVCKHLADLSAKAKIVPIIQVKDMPDEVEDRLSGEDLFQAMDQAIIPPSSGVALFCWDHAVEKGKEELVLEIVKRIASKL